MADIFLSYSSNDRERVRPVRNALAAMGYAIFWDLETPTGEDWDIWIRRNLAAARVAVVFWTRNSARSPNVRHEAAIARKSNKLVPAMLELMDVDDFPMGFYTTQAAALHDWSGAAAHHGYSTLLQALKKRMEADPGAAAQTDRQEESRTAQALQLHAEAGEAAAQAQLGYCYDVGQGVPKDDLHAARLYRMAADKGNANAQFRLGLAHEDGKGVARSAANAARLYKLAADQGHASAQYNLGVLTASGQGVAKDEREAARLYRLAADQDLADAQFALGYMHEGGLGVAKDDRSAALLYRKAAHQGVAEAQFNLAFMCAGGHGIPKDEQQAARLWQMAAAQGVKKRRLPTRRTI